MNRNDRKSIGKFKKRNQTIGWRKEVHMRPQSEVIEDLCIKTKENRKVREKRLKRLLELKAPQELIDIERKCMEETELDRIRHRQEEEKERKEWFKNNKIRKEVVDNIYYWFEHECPKLTDHHFFMYNTNIRWDLDPLGDHIGMTEDEFEYRMYDDIIHHLWNVEAERRRKNLDFSNLKEHEKEYYLESGCCF